MSKGPSHKSTLDALHKRIMELEIAVQTSTVEKEIKYLNQLMAMQRKLDNAWRDKATDPPPPMANIAVITDHRNREFWRIAF